MDRFTYKKQIAMKRKIIRKNGLIHRIKWENDAETVYGKGLTDYEYLSLMRIMRQYRKQL